MRTLLTLVLMFAASGAATPALPTAATTTRRPAALVLGGFALLNGLVLA